MSDEPTKIDRDPDLHSSDAPASLRPEHGNTESETSGDLKYDIMISYAHTNKDTVWKINDGLVNHGYKVWIDKDKMTGKLMECIPNAINNSEIVLFCVSEAYYKSDYCQLEAEFTHQRKPFIPVIVEEGNKNDTWLDGWLGFLLGSQYYIKFDKTQDFEGKLGQLIKEIEQTREGKNSTPPSGPSNTPTKNQEVSEGGDQPLNPDGQLMIPEGVTINIYNSRVGSFVVGSHTVGHNYIHPAQQTDPHSAERHQGVEDDDHETEPSAILRPDESSIEGHLKHVGHGIYVNFGKPLRERYPVFEGERRLGEGLKNNKLAVKIYHVAEDLRGEDLKNFRREVNAMCDLPPNRYVARFIHCGNVLNSVQPALYIAMDLQHETTLADIDTSTMTDETRIAVFLQICHGLKHLHDNSPPVAHLDLKPSNLLFSLNGKNAVVADFGLSKEAKFKHKDGKTTISWSAACYGGTLGWTPAELIEADKQQSASDKKPDFLKADIFSLGLVGCYILHDKFHPFSDPNDLKQCELKAMQNHLNIAKKEQPNFDPLKSKPDGHIAADLFQKMLSHEPRERPSIDQVLQHCMFWDHRKKVNFVQDMNKHLERQANATNEGCDGQGMEDGSIHQKFSESPGADNRTSAQADSMEQTGSAADSKKLAALNPHSSQLQSQAHWSESETNVEELRQTIVQLRMKESKEDLPESSRSASRNLLKVMCDGHYQREEFRATWEYWYSICPEFLPHLQEVMESTLKEEDKEQYVENIATPHEINLKAWLKKKYQK